MIIYDKHGLQQVRVQEEASVAHRKGLITEDELSRIKHAHPSPFYTPNLFVRAGFFLLTCIISFFGSGLIALTFGSALDNSISLWILIIALANYGMLELLTRQNRYYRAGVDDALMWISGGLFVGFFVSLIDHSLPNDLGISAFVLFIALFFTLRFTDALVAAVAYLAFFACVFFAWQKAGDFGLLTMPFILILVSGFGYGTSTKWENAASACYYRNCLLAVQLASLLTLYLSGNYYVVKELGDMLHGTTSKTIPLAWFFWFWTIALPFVYIGFGVRRKSLLLIRTGLLLIAGAVFTFRTYYHVLPVEQALSIGGLILVAAAWLLVKFLRQVKGGFTSKAEAEQKDGEMNVESLIVAETFAGVGSEAPEGNFFGGGKFGGGGSSGSF